jgi:drug/metabolite transporter (DMT)-like permease
VSLAVLCALLAAAAMHAGWNALVRRDSDSNATTVAVAGGGIVIGLALTPILPAIEPAAIPYVLGSSATHVLYYALVARAYRLGELSVVYPIMRGLAPLIVSIAAALLIEPASLSLVAGAAVLGGGIVLLGADGLRSSRAGIGAAVLNALVIAGYTIIDGLGARASASPAAYTAWIEVGGGIATLAWQFSRNGAVLARAVAKRAPIGLAGGAMSFGAYAIALWAMTVAPIGAVAAVRESSVLFATALGALVLHERFGPRRWLSTALVLAGIIVVKVGSAG